MLVLPSGRHLRNYKNSCSQNPGLNDSVGKWMAQEAMKRKIGPEGKEGGIILDEMAIQVCWYNVLFIYSNKHPILVKPFYIINKYKS